MDKLAEVLKGIEEEGERCVIFREYIEMGKMMKEVGEKMFGEGVEFLNGRLWKHDGEKMVEGLEKKELKMLIVCLKGGGRGVKLSAGNDVID
ncbi:helicase-related protein [Bacillus altitudinis]|uniref:helicase-related protein n=1 Tax=Bacillus altitudinis TaxID=293387 RepID=UPI002357A403|nr:helicase-related protein [Bacillus altitudinis]